MAKLNQIIAVEKGIKSRSHQELSDAHHALQKPALLAGIARTYQWIEAQVAAYTDVARGYVL